MKKRIKITKKPLRIFKVFAKKQPSLILICCSLALSSGCVARRGVDFGHWAMRGERINTVRVITPENLTYLNGSERILLLPPLGEMPEDNLLQLQRNMHQEMLNYFNGAIYTINREGQLKNYLQHDNLISANGQFDLWEAGRIGELLGATHVLCVFVHNFRPYPPQILTMSLVLIETGTHTATAEMDATFDASQQEVIIAADQYMQRRLAREYNAQNLDVMLRSPAQYSAFVSSNCARILAQVMYNNTNNLREEENTPISIEEKEDSQNDENQPTRI